MKSIRLLTCVAVLSIASIYVADAAVPEINNTVGRGSTGGKRKQKNAEAQQQQRAEAEKYPNATRKSPSSEATKGNIEKLQKLNALSEAGKNDEIIALAREIAGSSSANAWDRAVADQAMTYAYLAKQDQTNGMQSLQKALAEDALPNNSQFEMTYQLAQLQFNASQYDATVATLDKLMADTHENKADWLSLKGTALYQAKRYPEAVEALNKAMASSDKPDENTLQMLMSSYIQMKQPAEAGKIAQDLLVKNPNDKKMLMLLASVYMQSGQNDKAVELLNQARSRNLLTDEDDYRQLYALYANMKGKDKETIAVINEGLGKGILKPSAEVYTALAQAYFYTDQTPKAIDAYTKADAASSDGEAALNLARILSNAQRYAEAKATAERALKKGLKQPADANKLIGLMNKQLGKK